MSVCFLRADKEYKKAPAAKEAIRPALPTLITLVLSYTFVARGSKALPLSLKLCI